MLSGASPVFSREAAAARSLRASARGPRVPVPSTPEIFASPAHLEPLQRLKMGLATKYVGDAILRLTPQARRCRRFAARDGAAPVLFNFSIVHSIVVPIP